MWGSWFTATTAVVALLILVIASAFLGSPLLALIVAVVGLAVVAGFYALRRGVSQPATGKGASANPLTNPRSPDRGGAPVAGEGSEPRDGALP